MHIHTAYKRLHSLSKHEVERFLKACEDEIERYLFVTRNYNEQMMDKHGGPYLKRLEDRRDAFKRRLEELTGL